MENPPVRPGDMYAVHNRGKLQMVVIVGEDIPPEKQEDADEFLCFILSKTPSDLAEWDEMDFVFHSPEVRSQFIHDLQLPLPTIEEIPHVKSLDPEHYMSKRPDPSDSQMYEISYNYFSLKELDVYYDEPVIKIESRVHYFEILEELQRAQGLTLEQLIILRDFAVFFPSPFNSVTSPRLTL